MRLIDADVLVPNEVHTIIRLTATGEQTESVVYAEQIDNAPTVDAVERKRGEWIEENRRPKSMMFYCSECHRTAYDPQNHHGGQKRCRYAFCPNCGADMRGENNG